MCNVTYGWLFPSHIQHIVWSSRAHSATTRRVCLRSVDLHSTGWPKSRCRLPTHFLLIPEVTNGPGNLNNEIDHKYVHYCLSKVVVFTYIISHISACFLLNHCLYHYSSTTKKLHDCSSTVLFPSLMHLYSTTSIDQFCNSVQNYHPVCSGLHDQHTLDIIWKNNLNSDAMQYPQTRINGMFNHIYSCISCRNYAELSASDYPGSLLLGQRKTSVAFQSWVVFRSTSNCFFQRAMNRVTY